MKLTHPKGKDYIYIIEDGQFSRTLEYKYLIGYEGGEVKLSHDGELITCYILKVEDNYVHCIGNMERSFPKDLKEHEKLKSYIL